MTGKKISLKVALCSWSLMAVIQAGFLCALSAAEDKAALSSPTSASSQQPADVIGTWSGRFVSKHPENPSFTIKVVIAPDSNGDLIGQSTLSSRCLKHAQLKITVEGSKIVFAGSDEQGDSLTVRGTIDETGALVNSTYILDGSATGRCEPDDGTGTLTRQ